IDAPPFTPRTCHIRWPDPGSLTGACVIWSLLSTSISVRDQIVDPGLIITLLLDDKDLPAAMRASVHDAIAQALGVVRLYSRVPANEYVAAGRDQTGAIVSTRATVPLEAETEFALPSGADVITPAPCGSALCGAQSSVATIGPSASNQWIVLVRPSISWR